MNTERAVSNCRQLVYRCRKIGEAGSQQLLLDTQAIKGLLLDLPAAGIPPLPPLLALPLPHPCVVSGLYNTINSRSSKKRKLEHQALSSSASVEYGDAVHLSSQQKLSMVMQFTFQVSKS